MKQIPDSAKELLHALGYDDKDIAVLQKENAEQIEKHNEELIEEATDYFAAFTSVSGAVVLEKLKDRTTRLSTMDKSNAIIDGDIPLNPAEFMAFREGQNALIRYICKMIIIATKKDGE